MGISNGGGEWLGRFKSGRGAMRPAHGETLAFTTPSRFEGDTSSGNPEELIGAALSGCFSMALALGLEKAGAVPQRIRTNAAVHIDEESGSFSITTIDLVSDVEVDGIDDAAFQRIAQETKDGCPVSKALRGVRMIRLTARRV